jgi:hypothetical protein
MRKLFLLTAAATFVAMGAVGAEADSLHKLHARTLRPGMTGYEATYHPYLRPAPAWRAPPAVAPQYFYPDYRSVGLSDNPDDCNKGCALSNGS